MRVLVIDDDPLLARSLALGLGDEGFAVSVAADGRSGLARAAAEPFDAVVLDLLLPGMNGYVVCRELRAAGVTTPILMLTAKDGEYDEAEGLDTGADDFLRKPFSFVVLVARLRALARRGPGRRGTLMVSGALAYDPVSRRCTLDGREVPLTPRESALLEVLLRAEGEPVDKLDLLDEVWGHGRAADVNLVEVYIRLLRRKLGAPRVQTIRGVCYRLAPLDAEAARPVP